MSSKSSINLVFQTDDGHAWMTCIAIRSLVDAFSRCSESRHTYSLRVSFIAHGLSESNRQLLNQACTSDASDVKTEFIDCPLMATNPAERRIELFKTRLCLPEVLPHLSRILCLDSDILVLSDISKLWEIDLRGHWLGAAACLSAADDICLRNYNHEFKVQFKQAIDPVNGGVVMMDLGKMRELGATRTMLDWLHIHRDTVYNPDQEAISMYCAGQFTFLPPEWNYRLFAEPYWASSWTCYNEYLKLQPSLVHFQSPLRPNLLWAKLPYFSEWIDYYNKFVQCKLSPKRVGYFMFVYFEFYFLIAQLARGIASYRWRTFLTGVFLFPYAIIKYLQYVLRPDKYCFRIWKTLSES